MRERLRDDWPVAYAGGKSGSNHLKIIL